MESASQMGKRKERRSYVLFADWCAHQGLGTAGSVELVSFEWTTIVFGGCLIYSSSKFEYEHFIPSVKWIEHLKKISLLCLPSLHLLKNTVKTAILWEIITINITGFFFKYTLHFILFLLLEIWIFSIITPVFSVTWSFRNHSNMLIWCSRKFSYYFLYFYWTTFSGGGGVYELRS